MQVDDLIKKVCDKGEASAKEVEKGANLEGALLGFKLCRDAAGGYGYPPTRYEPQEIVDNILRLIKEENEKAVVKMNEYHSGVGTLNDYWKQRYCVLQIEWVYEVLNVGLKLKDTVSARAVMVYADIVGVKDEQDEDAS